jgi:hypothetical protein
MRVGGAIAALELVLTAFPNCPRFPVSDREKVVADRKQAGNAARKGHKSGGRQEMRYPSRLRLMTGAAALATPAKAAAEMQIVAAGFILDRTLLGRK